MELGNKRKACSDVCTSEPDPNEESEKNRKFYMWLHSMVREVGSGESEDNDIGTITFTVKNVIYSVPFTAFLELIDTRGQKSDGKFKKVKDTFEKKHGPVCEIIENLKLLVGSLKEGAKLAGDAGMEDTPAPKTYSSDEMEEELSGDE